MAGRRLAERHDAHQHGAASTSSRRGRSRQNLTPQHERLLELDADLSLRLGAPARVQHHPQDTVDAEPGVPEAGVGVVRFAFGPRGSTVSAGLHSTTGRMRADSESDGTVQVT
jgi:hypothetical protein